MSVGYPRFDLRVDVGAGGPVRLGHGKGMSLQMVDTGARRGS